MSTEKTKDVSDWWSSNPQTYGDLHGKPLYGGERDAFGEAEFFENADRTMFEYWAHIVPMIDLPLHRISMRLYPHGEWKRHR